MRLQTAALLVLSRLVPSTASLVSNPPQSPQLLDAICSARTDGRSRCEVELDVPSSCVPSGVVDPACPVVFFFHGGGGTNDGFKNTAGVHDNDVIGVYPQGENGWNTGPKNSNECSWDDYDCTVDPDEGDLMASIIAEVRGRGATGRIYAIGSSNGAALAHRLAANAGTSLPLSGIVTKVTQLLESPARNGPGVLNYNQPGPNGSGSTRKVSVLNVMGTSDTVIPYEGGTAGVLGGNDPNFLLMHSHISMETWAAHNGCSVTPTTTSMHTTDLGSGVAAFYGYGGCADGHIVEHYAIEGGGHNSGRAVIDGVGVTHELAYDFIRRVEAGLDGVTPPGPTPPTPATTAGTTVAPPTGCSDDPTWHGRASADHTCAYVALEPSPRCGWVSTDGTLASEACPETCGNCPTTPSPTPGPVATTTAATTAAPPTGCMDDPTWHGRVSADHTCDHVALRPDVRCSWLSTDGTLASEACAEACGSCSTTSTTTAASTTSTTTTSATNICTECTNEPTPWMVDNGRDCDTNQNALNKKCFEAPWWVNGNYCELSCYSVGRGYGSICCQSCKSSGEVCSASSVCCSGICGSGLCG